MASEENGGSGVKDDVYLRCIEVIRTVRDLEAFSNRHIEIMLGYEQSTARDTINSMMRIGCVSHIGKMKSQYTTKLVNHYQVDPMAITKLKIARGKDTEPAMKANPEKDKDDFLCGLKFVKKANVVGMGISYLNGLDQMLAGVRQ